MTGAVIFWITLSALIFFLWESKKTSKASVKAEDIVKTAEKRKNTILEEARKESYEITKKAEKIEERILEREEKIENKLEQIENKQDKIVQKEENLREEREKLEEKKLELEWKLAEMSKLTEKEARSLFIEQIKEKFEEDWIDIIKKYKKKIEDEKKEE